MSKKIVDPLDALRLYKADPTRSISERSWLERRLQDEADAQAREDAAIAGAQSVTDAKLVMDPVTHRLGVAVRGARFVCTLPNGYGGPGCELIAIDDGMMVVTQPDMTPLCLDPKTGSTRKL